MQVIVMLFGLFIIYILLALLSSVVSTVDLMIIGMSCLVLLIAVVYGDY